MTLLKTIGIYNYNKKDFEQLEEMLKQSGILLKPLLDKQTEEGIDLYAFNIDSEEGFEINFDRPFIIISSINDSTNLRKSLKIGALDYIHKPFVDLGLILKRLERAVEKTSSKEAITDVSIVNKYNKIIDIEIKRAHRGKYPLCLGNVVLEAKLNDEVLTKLVTKIKGALRESDSCMLYPNGDIYLLIPFADECGIIVVARKVIDLLNSWDYRSYCLCANFPRDGESREELISNFGRSLDTRELYK